MMNMKSSRCENSRELRAAQSLRFQLEQARCRRSNKQININQETETLTVHFHCDTTLTGDGTPIDIGESYCPRVGLH